MYSYSKAKGLFGGISIEGSVIVERQDANALAYGSNVSSKMLLSGAVPPPPWAEELINTLQTHTGGIEGWVNDESPKSPNEVDYAFQGVGSSRDGGKSRFGGSPFSPGWGKKKRPATSYFPETSPAHDPIPAAGRYSEDQPHSSTVPPPQRSQFKAANPFRPVTSNGHSTPSGFPRQPITSSKPTFETHFDSDFDPLAPPPSSQPPHRLSLSMPKIPLASSNSNPPSPFTALSPTSDPTTARTTTAFSRSDNFVSSTYKNGNTTPPSAVSETSVRTKPLVHLEKKRGLQEPLTEGIGRAIALFDFHAQEVRYFPSPFVLYVS